VQEAGKNLEQFFERSVVGSGRWCLGAMVGKRRSFEGLQHFLERDRQMIVSEPQSTGVRAGLYLPFDHLLSCFATLKYNIAIGELVIIVLIVDSSQGT